MQGAAQHREVLRHAEQEGFATAVSVPDDKAGATDILRQRQHLVTGQDFHFQRTLLPHCNSFQRLTEHQPRMGPLHQFTDAAGLLPMRCFDIVQTTSDQGAVSSNKQAHCQSQSSNQCPHIQSVL